MNSVKEAPAEQMVLKLALEFSLMLSQPTGTAWHIKPLSFYLVMLQTGSLFGQITQWVYEAKSHPALRGSKAGAK